MEEFIIDSFVKFNEIIERYKKSNLWIFRGQSDVSWELIPKLGRNPFNKYDEQRLISSWKNRAYEFVDKISNEDNWGWIFLAQHHGLPTRLLDWTYNPLIAAYFSARDNFDTDSAIYALHYSRYIDVEKINPFKIKQTSVVIPQNIVTRMVRQCSIFTVHPDPSTSLVLNSNFNAIEKITVVNSFKKEFLFKLNQIGYNEAAIFPDLDGLARHICWHIKNMDYWDTMINN